jgi:predicted amidohydrolase YtcJ
VAELGVAVVTQPSLVELRGDHYLDDVEAADRPFLWPYRSLLAAGVKVGCSSDAPYGDPDPWAGLRAARDRRAASGRVVGAGEQVDASTALAGYLSAAARPGGPPRALAPGVPADLVVLDTPLPTMLADPDARHVRATFVAGEMIHGER